MSEDNNRDQIKIEDATITGEEGKRRLSLDDLSGTSREKGKEGKRKSIRKKQIKQ